MSVPASHSRFLYGTRFWRATLGNVDLSRVARIVAGTAAVAAVQEGCAYASPAGVARVHGDVDEQFSGVGADLAGWPRERSLPPSQR